MNCTTTETAAGRMPLEPRSTLARGLLSESSMHLLKMSFLFALAMCAVPAAARAQDAEPPVGRARATDHFRVDFLAPVLSLGGIYHTSGLHSDGMTLDIALDLRVVHGSGHGFALRGGITVGRVDLFPAIDANYLYSFQLAGDRSLGLTLQLLTGVSFAHANDCVGPLGGCVDQVGVDGFHAGANAGTALVFQAYGFTLGIDARYRVLAPTDPAAPGEAWEPLHAISAGLLIGFGFY